MRRDQFPQTRTIVLDRFLTIEWSAAAPATEVSQNKAVYHWRRTSSNQHNTATPTTVTSIDVTNAK